MSARIAVEAACLVPLLRWRSKVRTGDEPTRPLERQLGPRQTRGADRRVKVLAASSIVLRVQDGILNITNWLQLLRFGIVGAGGYAVNLVVFAVMVQKRRGGHHCVAATVAFLAAVNSR